MLNLVSSLVWGVRMRPWTGAGGPTSFTLIFRSSADPLHPGVSVLLPSPWMSWLPTSLIRYSLSWLWSFGSSKSGTDGEPEGDVAAEAVAGRRVDGHLQAVLAAGIGPGVGCEAVLVLALDFGAVLRRRPGCPGSRSLLAALDGGPWDLQHVGGGLNAGRQAVHRVAVSIVAAEDNPPEFRVGLRTLVDLDHPAPGPALSLLVGSGVVELGRGVVMHGDRKAEGLRVRRSRRSRTS